MIRRGWNGTLCMTGGDTLMGFMRLTGVTELVPICEIGKGQFFLPCTGMAKEFR